MWSVLWAPRGAEAGPVLWGPGGAEAGPVLWAPRGTEAGRLCDGLGTGLGRAQVLEGAGGLRGGCWPFSAGTPRFLRSALLSSMDGVCSTH